MKKECILTLLCEDACLPEEQMYYARVNLEELKIHKIEFIYIFILSLIINPSIAQINDPYIPQGVSEAISIPWITLGIASCIIIAFAIFNYQENYQLTHVRKKMNIKPRIKKIINYPKAKPINQLLELEEPPPIYSQEDPQIIDLKKFTWITEQNLEKLNQINIYNTHQFFQVGATHEGISKIHNETGISKSLIYQWLTYKDLMRIPSINDLNAELLFRLGIDSVDILSQWDAAILSNILKKKYDGKDYLNLPSESMITRWIQIANSFKLGNSLRDVRVGN
jgi:hypothetical protein